MKTIFFGAPVDQMEPAYLSGFNPLAVESNVTSSSQQPNGGQYQQPPTHQPLGGHALDSQVLLTAGGRTNPTSSRGQGQGQVTGGNHHLSNL